MLLNTKPHIKSHRNIQPPQKYSRISGKETPIPRSKLTFLTTSGVSLPVSANTAYPSSGGLKAIQEHSSTTATTALLQQSSSVVAVTPLVGLQAGSGVRRDLQALILRQNLYSSLCQFLQKTFKSYWQKMFSALFA